MKMNPIKIATVCSGIGSPEQALKNLNVPHEISFACEIDKYARQTYSANFNPNVMYEDMTKENWDKPEQYSDIFIGGIPCQAFSLAGKRLGELDPRGLLFFDFYRYVKNQMPKVFIIENVKGLLSDNNGKTFQNWIQLLGKSLNTQNIMFQHEDSLGYNLHFKVLNSKDFGVPQNRERVFLVGIRADLPNEFRFPIGWKLDKRLKDVLEDDVDEKYYLSEKMLEGATFNSVSNIAEPELIKSAQLGGSHESSGRVYSQEGLSPTITAKQGGGHEPFIEVIEPRCVAMRGRYSDNGKIEQKLEHNSKGITNTITSVQKDNLIIEEVIQLNQSKESGGKQPYQQNRVYSDTGLMTTLDTESGRKSIMNNHRIRRLTPLECFRLQGYPDEYIKPCSDSQTYKQAGNSITVSVMQAIINNTLPIIQA